MKMEKYIKLSEYLNMNHIYDIIYADIELIANNMMRSINFDEIKLKSSDKGTMICKKIDIETYINPDALSFSSSEKFIVNVAIRIAFCKLNRGFTSNFFIMDESFTSISKDKIYLISKIIEILRSMFKWTLVISHMADVNSTFDHTYNIKRNEIISSINII